MVRVTARLRKDVHRRLVQEAKASGISVNDEIERRIEASFAGDDGRAERLTLLTALDFFLQNYQPAAAVREAYLSKRLDMSPLKAAIERIKEAHGADSQKTPPEVPKDEPRSSRRE
jgi:hypothetical protein